MKKLLLGTVSLLVCFIIAMGGSPFAAESTTDTVDIYAPPFGTSGYILAQSLDEESKVGNYPVNIVATERPGTVWCLKHMLATPDHWKNTIINSNFTIMWLAQKGIVKFKKPEPEAFNFKLIGNFSVLSVHFVTYDPDIKTVHDLDGKRLGIGAKGQVGYEVLPHALLDAMKINPDYSYLGTSGAMKALLDKKVDAAIVGLYWGSNLVNFAPGPPYMELEASGRKFYHIDWTNKVVEAIDKAMGGSKVQSLTIPANSLANQSTPITIPAHAPGYWAHKSFPEEAAYFATKVYLDNYKKFYQRHSTLKIITPELMVMGFKDSPEDIHPGALRAYREAGVIK